MLATTNATQRLEHRPKKLCAHIVLAVWWTNGWMQVCYMLARAKQRDSYELKASFPSMTRPTDQVFDLAFTSVEKHRMGLRATRPGPLLSGSRSNKEVFLISLEALK